MSYSIICPHLNMCSVICRNTSLNDTYFIFHLKVETFSPSELVVEEIFNLLPHFLSQPPNFLPLASLELVIG